jgi:polysaccharide biosynthesis/export protein
MQNFLFFISFVYNFNMRNVVISLHAWGAMKGLLCSFMLLGIIFSPVLAASAVDYIIGEGDVLKISVYDHPDMTTVARVSGEGEIYFPLIGKVAVGGMNLTKITEKITTLLSDGYIVEPQVSVFIEEFKSKKVVLMGQVEKPGLYVLHGQTTVLELLSNAGGLTKDAGDKAVIKRKSEGSAKEEDRITVDLKKLVAEGDMSQDVPILDGDSIYIGKAGVFYISGEIKKPDAYKYEEGLTVVKAATKAGGFTEIAAPGRIKILRKVNGKEKVMEKVDLNERVLPEDVIIVPESFF